MKVSSAQSQPMGEGYPATRDFCTAPCGLARFYCNVIFLGKTMILNLITGFLSSSGYHCCELKIHRSIKLTTTQINAENKIFYSCRQEWESLIFPGKSMILDLTVIIYLNFFLNFL